MKGQQVTHPSSKENTGDSDSREVMVSSLSCGLPQCFEHSSLGCVNIMTTKPFIQLPGCSLYSVRNPGLGKVGEAALVLYLLKKCYN